MANKINWGKTISCLVLSGIFAAFGNWINTTKSGNPVTPLDAAPGIIILILITLAGYVIWGAMNKVLGGKNLPALAYISLLSIILTLPGMPTADFFVASMNKIGLLPLCTPILAYAGISIGKDLDTFKKQGVAIVIVTLFAFLGTFVGSAIIAQVVMKAQGII